MRHFKNHQILVTLYFILYTFYVLPLPVFAQTPTPVNIGKAFLFGTLGVSDVFTSLSTVINILLPNIFILTGQIFLILLIFAGVSVILSAGSGNPEGAKKAKATATSAALGLFLVIAAYWLIQIIEFVTGIQIFNPNLPF